MTELRHRPGDQPLPVPNDRADIQSQVIADIAARRGVPPARVAAWGADVLRALKAQTGRKPSFCSLSSATMSPSALQPHNGRDALRDLYEEMVDAVCYLKQLMVERDAARRCICSGDSTTGEDIDVRPDCPVHGDDAPATHSDLEEAPF